MHVTKSQVSPRIPVGFFRRTERHTTVKIPIVEQMRKYSCSLVRTLFYVCVHCTAFYINVREGGVLEYGVKLDSW